MTEKNTELLNEIMEYKEQVENINNANQKLKIENSSQQQALIKLTSLSKNDNQAKQNALMTIKDLNKKLSESLQTINTKDNEIKKLKEANLKYQNDLSELTTTLKNKENIVSQINILKKQERQCISPYLLLDINYTNLHNNWLKYAHCDEKHILTKVCVYILQYWIYYPNQEHLWPWIRLMCIQ